jgi:hypothetical protein
MDIPEKKAIMIIIVINMESPLGTPNLQNHLQTGYNSDPINNPNDRITRKFLAMMMIKVNAIKKINRNVALTRKD